MDNIAPVFKFLLGEGPLRGVEFGDRHPDERGAFWWRKDLRAARAAQPAASAEPSKDDVVALYHAAMTETRGGFAEAVNNFARARVGIEGDDSPPPVGHNPMSGGAAPC